MQNFIARSIFRLAIAGTTIISLQACNTVTQPSANLVAQAYETSGVISISPYQRTIFSSSNF